jgi:hypothetical protein
MCLIPVVGRRIDSCYTEIAGYNLKLLLRCHVYDCQISCSHGGEYEDGCLLGCCVI